MKKNPTQVVILIFTDNKKVFVEKRLLEGFDQEQYLMPGGKVRELENIEQALKREAMEELGIIPLDFIPLDEEIVGHRGEILRPFIINHWKGDLPKTILDEGNTTIWLEIEEVLNCSFKPSRKVAAALKKYLKKYDSSQA